MEQALINHQIIRRAMHNAAGQFEVYFTEFSATWFDPGTEKTVDFTGSVDSQISIETAQIQGSDVRIHTQGRISFSQAIGSARLMTAHKYHLPDWQIRR